MSSMAEPADINVDELRRRARRRLVGAVVLALGVAVVVPMLLETEQKPLGEDVSVKIPPVDDGKFVNRLSEQPSTPGKPADATAPTPVEPSPTKPDDSSVAKSADAPPPTSAEPAPARTSKYDTHVPGAQDAAPKADAASPPASVPSTAPAPPAPAPKAPATPVSEARGADSAPPAPASRHEGFAVQLAAFADDKGANSLAGRLKRAGYAAYTEPLKTSKGTLWRVRVGPYPSREAAVAARDKLKTEGQNGIVAAIR